MFVINNIITRTHINNSYKILTLKNTETSSNSTLHHKQEGGVQGTVYKRHLWKKPSIFKLVLKVPDVPDGFYFPSIFHYVFPQHVMQQHGITGTKR